jgi:hypothetical protein
MKKYIIKRREIYNYGVFYNVDFLIPELKDMDAQGLDTPEQARNYAENIIKLFGDK